MSHLSEVHVDIRDIEALKDAVRSMGLRLVKGGIGRGFGAQKFQEDYMIPLEGGYDVGLRKQKDGRFTLIYDRWRGAVESELGKDCGRLVQQYGVAKIKRLARQRGKRVVQKTMSNGAIQLRITV